MEPGRPGIGQQVEKTTRASAALAALTAVAAESSSSASAKPLFLETVQEVMENPRLSAELSMAIHNLIPMHVNDDRSARNS